VALHRDNIRKPADGAERELVLERVAHPRALVRGLELVHVSHATEGSADHLIDETTRRVERRDAHAQTLAHGEGSGLPRHLVAEGHEALGDPFDGAFVRAPPADVFCVASHGTKTMALYALPIRPKGLICNDGGRGLDDSGIEGLAEMAREGLAAVAVSSASARIGDALSTYHDGIVSAANEPARAKGVTTGMRAAEAARRMLV